MNDSEKIEALQSQIDVLTKQLKALKSATKIDYSKYYMFGDGKYEKGLCYAADFAPHIRTLASRLLKLKICTNVYGKRFLTVDSGFNTRNLTKTQTEYINDFINEIYPIVERYALITLDNKSVEGE